MDDSLLDTLADDLRARLLREPAPPGLPAADRIRDLVIAAAGTLSPAARDELERRVARRAFGFGPLDGLLADPDVDEIMVMGGSPIWVERAGRLERTAAAFEHEGELRDVIERILAPAGRRVDEAEPLCDARLADGSRVHVVLPPLAVDGPVLTIRRFRARRLDGADLERRGTWPADLHAVLAAAVRARLSILVSGGTGSGKTTTLGALAAAIGDTERVVTVEDTAELRLDLAHVVRLEARPASVEGRGAIGLRALVRNALRMRPDRIVVGEVRGGEALDMVSAMTTGHDGSLCTVHAGSPGEALRRLEVLALMADVDLPHAAVRALVADAVDLVVHQARLPGGERAVVAVGVVVRDGDDAGVLREVWRRAPDGGGAWLPAARDGRLGGLLHDVLGGDA